MCKVYYKKCKKIKSGDKEIEKGKFITEVENNKTYTNLGIEENASLEHKKLREKARKEYLKRLKRYAEANCPQKIE